MDSKEKQIKEKETLDAEIAANSLRANGKNQHRENTRKINRLWLWLGVLVLVAILLYWIFSIGLLESLTGVSNG